MDTNLNTDKEKLEEAIQRLEKAVELDKDNAYYLYYLGKAYALNQDPKTAISTFQRAIALDSGVKEYFYHLSRQLKEIGSIQEAKNNLEKALKLDWNYIEAHDLLAEIYFGEEKWEGAEVHSRAVLNLRWKYDTFSLLISALYHQNKFDMVIEECEKAPAWVRNEDTKDTVFYIARSLSQLDRFEDAIIDYQWLLKIGEDPAVFYYLACSLAHEKRYEEALKQFSNVIGHESEYKARAYLQRGHIFLQNNQIEEAKDDYVNAYKNDAQDPEILYALGRFCYLQGDYDNALSKFCQAIELNPEHYLSHLGKGLVHEGREEIPEAIEEYKRVIQVEKHPIALKRLGILHCKQLNYSAAFEHLQQANQLGDESDGLLFYLGLAAVNIKKFEMGLRMWEKLFERNPEDKRLELNICRIHYLLGRQYVTEERYVDAISEWEAYLKGYEGDQATKKNLAGVYFRLAINEIKKGESESNIRLLLSKAAELEPDNELYAYYESLFELKTGEYDECISTLRELLEKQPDNPRLKYHLGLAMLKKGDDGAIDVLKEVKSGRYAVYAAHLVANEYMKKERWHEAIETLAPMVGMIDQDILNIKEKPENDLDQIRGGYSE